MDPVLVLISVVLVTTLAILFLKESRKNWEFLKDVGGPPGLPVVGNAWDFVDTTQLFETVVKYYKTQSYRGLYKIKVGLYNIVIISDYKVQEFVLASTKILNKSVDYHFLRPWLGTGLLTSDGPKWKTRRKILTPAFHFKILEQFIDVFESAGNILIKKLDIVGNSPSLDIYPLITLCTLDIICESAMGTKVNAQQNQQSSYVQSVKDLCRISVERGISPFQRSSLLYPLTPNFYTERKALSVVHSYTNSIITKRREELRQRGANGNTEVEENDIGMKRKSAFLDLLLRSTIDGKPLSQEDIREEVDTFMFEGHDTTASAITFALYSLAANPEVQKLVLEEQVKIFGPDLNPEAVTHTNLQDMHYLELVIKETLRLYPSVPFFFRQTDQEIEYNGRMIPKDLTLAIFPFGMQRDPRFFPDPEKFNPNRFDEIDGKLPYAYVPFSAGPRNCIGQKFAMLEMKSTISKVLRRFELLSAVPNHQLQLAAEAVLKSKNGVRIGIRRR